MTNKDIYCVFALFICIFYTFSFIVTFCYLTRKKNERKKYLLELAKKQIPNDEEILFMMGMSPLITIAISTAFSSGFLFVFSSIFLILTDGYQTNFLYIFLFGIAFLIGVPYLCRSYGGFDFLAITEKCIYPIIENDRNKKNPLEQPIYLEQIKRIIPTFSTNSGIELYIEFHDNRTPVTIQRMNYSRKIKNFLKNRIKKNEK